MVGIAPACQPGRGVADGAGECHWCACAVTLRGLGCRRCPETCVPHQALPPAPRDLRPAGDVRRRERGAAVPVADPLLGLDRNQLIEPFVREGRFGTLVWFGTKSRWARIWEDAMFRTTLRLRRSPAAACAAAATLTGLTGGAAQAEDLPPHRDPAGLRHRRADEERRDDPRQQVGLPLHGRPAGQQADDHASSTASCATPTPGTKELRRIPGTCVRQKSRRRHRRGVHVPAAFAEGTHVPRGLAAPGRRPRRRVLAAGQVPDVGAGRRRPRRRPHRRRATTSSTAPRTATGSGAAPATTGCARASATTRSSARTATTAS